MHRIGATLFQLCSECQLMSGRCLRSRRCTAESFAQLDCGRNAVETEGVKALFHLGSVLGAVVLSILSRPTDGIRIPMRLPWVISVVMYCFYFSFTAVSHAANVTTLVNG